MLLYGDRHISYHYLKETGIFLSLVGYSYRLSGLARSETAPYSNRQLSSEVNKQEVLRTVTSPRLPISKHTESATILLLTEFNNKLTTEKKNHVKIIHNCFWWLKKLHTSDRNSLWNNKSGGLNLLPKNPNVTQEARWLGKKASA